MIQKLERRLAAVYLAVALGLTSLLCIVTAPFFGPDEPSQALRAISVSHGELVLPAHADDTGNIVDDNVMHVMATIDDLRMTWEKTTPDFLDRPYGPIAGLARQAIQITQSTVRWSRTADFLGFNNTAGYPPFLYIPASLAWRIGESANWSIFATLRLSRLFCALAAVALGWLALRIGAAVRWRLLAFLLLPSVLFLNACCSEDAVMLSVAALAAALLIRAVAGHRSLTRTELIAAATCIALCAMARPPYAAMALALLLPSVESHSRESQASSWRVAASAAAAVVTACAIWRWLVTKIIVDTADTANPALQRLFFQHHPLVATTAIIRGTTGAAGDFFHRGLYVVGWDDLLPHHGAAAALTICIAAIALLAPGINLSRKGWTLLAAATILPLVGISAAEYIIWTPPGSHTVFGIQPRYWLPVMPLAMMLCRQISPRLRWLPPTAAAAIAAIACTLPIMEAHAFYSETLWHVLAMNWR